MVNIPRSNQSPPERVDPVFELWSPEESDTQSVKEFTGHLWSRIQ